LPFYITACRFTRSMSLAFGQRVRSPAVPDLLFCALTAGAAKSGNSRASPHPAKIAVCRLRSETERHTGSVLGSIRRLVSIHGTTPNNTNAYAGTPVGTSSRRDAVSPTSLERH